MRNNYRLPDGRRCDNCAFSEDFDVGDLRCYRFPQSHKNDSRHVESYALCDDHRFRNCVRVQRQTVRIDDPNKSQYTCEVLIPEYTSLLNIITSP